MSSPDVVITRGKKYNNNNNKRKNFSSLQDSCIYMYSVKTVTSFFRIFSCRGKIFVGLPTSETRTVCEGEKNRMNCVRKPPNETKDKKYFFGNRKPSRKKNTKLVWYFLGLFCVSASNFSGVYLLSEKPDYYVRRLLHIIYTYIWMYCSHRTSNIIAGLKGTRIGTRVLFSSKIGFRLEQTSIYT